ncbi:MAG: anti-sigma factor antagonist [Cryptosporangiaceae bacterium]|jgi:anti-anti-sigma factor|nr:anti-sigma factor antagonist [Cryptosporangiaceae bacterium]
MDEHRGRNGAPRLRHRTRSGTLAEMAIAREDHGSAAVLTLTGELDVTTGAPLRDALHDLAEEGIAHHVVDLRQLRFLDSTGLGILVGHHKRLAEHGGTLQVITGPGLVGGVFRLTGVDQLIPVRDSLAACLAAANGAADSKP